MYMILYHGPTIILKNQIRRSPCAMNDEIGVNTFLGFVHNTTQLSVDFATSRKTSCSSNLYGQQRVIYQLGSKGCGCYGISTNSTSILIQHANTVKIPFHGPFHMNDFYSLKFSKLYLNGDISGSCKLYMQLTDILRYF